MSTFVSKFIFFIQKIFINKCDNPQLFCKAWLRNNWTGISTHFWCYWVFDGEIDEIAFWLLDIFSQLGAILILFMLKVPCIVLVPFKGVSAKPK